MSAVGKTVEQPISDDDPTLSRSSAGEPACGSTNDDESADDDCDPPETYDEYGSWKDDYADAVGISRWREL